MCAVLAAVALATACGGGDSSSPTAAPPTVDPPRATTVMVSPATVELDVGETVQLAAEVRDQNSNVMAGASVTWMSGTGTVATVDATGLVAGVAVGTATITASAGSAQGTAQITVVTAPVVSVEVSSPAEPIALGEPLQLGETLQLSAEALDENGRPIPGVVFSWESSDTSVATVDATGLVTGVAAGTATITASAGDVRTSVEITVVSATNPVVSVDVSPSAETIVIGVTLQLSAEALDENGQAVSDAEFSWESSDISVATVDATGLVTGVAAGTATITASAGDVQGAVEITVVSATPTVVSVEVSPFAETIVVGMTLQLSAEALDENGQAVSDAEFSWESSNTSVAAVDATGLVTGVAEGAATITASAGGVRGRAHIAVANPVASPDRGILEAFYHATGGPNWVDSNNWLTDAPISEWHGVYTDAQGRVTEIYLTFNDMTGPLPPELGNLVALETLDLFWNDLTGPIPPELGNLASLTELDLGANGLSGSLPPELGNLASLTRLDLALNALSGSVPSELGNLSSLETLDLASNDLTGSIPPELANLPNLIELDLSSNEFTGSIPPELASLPRLEILDLSGGFRLGGTGLSGPIPLELTNLTGLKELYLNQNALTGPIPPELENLTSLEILNLGGNPLTGPIPPELGNLTNLRGLGIVGSTVTGPIPPELGNLTNLIELSLAFSGLSGPIPLELTNLTSLTDLWLSSNNLSGPVPPELGSLTNLTDLNLSRNNLSGPVPTELGNLTNLMELEIEHNELTGSVPQSFLALDMLTWFFFQGNAGLCAPNTAEFVAWLQSIDEVDGPFCSASSSPAR